jgi:hypothetical protein
VKTSNFSSRGGGNYQATSGIEHIFYLISLYCASFAENCLLPVEI